MESSNDNSIETERNLSSGSEDCSSDECKISQDGSLPSSMFASSLDLKNDSRLYDERRYLTNFRWAYFNHSKNGYMCKTCETFYGDLGCSESQNRGAWSHNAVILRDNPGKRFRRHNKSKKHLRAEELKTQVRIENTLHKVDDENAKKEKENINELYISKLIKIVHFLVEK